MSITSRILRLTRPRTFLYLMSLRTGTELATLTLLLNKVSGLYGLLALLTGLHLSPLQLSMYVYSVGALIITAFLAPHIRQQSPFHCLALATLFVIDTITNAAYTAAFGITWFLVLSQHHSDASGNTPPGAGGKMMDDAAGFTSPEFNVSKVDIVAGDANEAVTAGSGVPGSTAAEPSLGHGVMQPESISSIVVICALWAVRMYLVLVVMSYVRLVLRRHVSQVSRSNLALHSGSKSAGVMEDPFAEHLSEGKGWRGRLGRAMIALGRGYWLGAEEGDEEWMNEEIALGKLRRGGVIGEAPGVIERERRKRGGTVGAGGPGVSPRRS